jgi:hypothetical protein
MASTVTYRMAQVASAAATRARSVVPGAGLGANACSWPTATTALPGAKAIKPATQMFVDVLDHRRRRLSEPSP